MNRAMTAPDLTPVGEGRVALQSVKVEAEIENLLCKVTIRQTYRNLEKVNIEAVYTFPLPLGAVLLDMTIKTGTKAFKGVVVEKTEAEDRYEDAITDGDTAIMLEQIDPGLYTMNVGNLQPEECIDLSITYAELLKWRENSLRFFLPTTVAPRYGDPEILGLQPHQSPDYDLMHENPFSITVSVCGALAGALIESPSHHIASQRRFGKTVVSLAKRQALMDRDFVLNLSMETDKKSMAHVERDGEGYVALASFCPRFPAPSRPAPRCITIIVDCSGSMAGDSIAQARRALCEILGLLRPEDWFNVIRFGNSHRKLFSAPVAADAANLKKARALLEVLDADMGGTEIGQAVAAAVRSAASSTLSKEALLITDGEVWEWEKVTAMAAGSGFRFFTVGVGSSVSEAFVQSLADATGGACELVSPWEEMVEKIVRHFKRIYSPRAVKVQIHWPSEPTGIFSEAIPAIYEGDTLHVFGTFDERPDGMVELQAVLENGAAWVQKVPLQAGIQMQPPDEAAGTMARMAAACRMKTMKDPRDIADLGVKYQLMSPFTNCLAVDVRAEGRKALDLPVLRKTPQMLAAGWGASGSVLMNERFELRFNAERLSISKVEMSSKRLCCSTFMGYLESERRQFDGLIACINGIQMDQTAPFENILSLIRFEKEGMPKGLVKPMKSMVDAGADEHTAVIVLLYLLSQDKRIKGGLERTTRRMIKKSYKELSDVPEEMKQQIESIIESYLNPNAIDLRDCLEPLM